MNDVNVFPILISTIFGMGLGAFWYSEKTFGKAWMAAIGKTPETIGPAGPAMAGSVAACLVSALCMELLVVAAGATSPLAGLGMGALCGIGLVAPAMLSDALFSDRGMKLFAVQAGYRVTYLLLMGLVSGTWPR